MHTTFTGGSRLSHTDVVPWAVEFPSKSSLDTTTLPNKVDKSLDVADI